MKIINNNFSKAIEELFYRQKWQSEVLLFEAIGNMPKGLFVFKI